jgi:hypothetical protein
MFNLEEFKGKFEAGKVSEWDFYSTLVREFGEVELGLSKIDLIDLEEELKEFSFYRFVCLTGENNKKECQLMIDTKTGFLYSPKWFNSNTKEFHRLRDSTDFIKKIKVQNIQSWKVIPLKSFQDLAIKERTAWFKNKRIFTTRVYSDSDPDTYKYFINNNNEDGYGNNGFPFIYSQEFVDLNIWGNSFSKERFIEFLQKNSFLNNIDFVKIKLFNILRTRKDFIFPILQELQKSQKIQFHENLIDFPNSLFQEVSEVSKHNNLIGYIDFLLWKIENYSERNSSNLGKSNELYLKLSNLKSEIDELNRIKNYLFQKFDFSLENLKTKLLEFKNESINHLEILDSQNSIWDFEPEPKSFNFELLGETLTRLYNNQISKVSSFSDEVDFLLKLSGKVENLFRASHNFLTGQRESLRQSCEKEYVGDEFEKLFSEWSSEISGLESRYFPVIQAYFNGSLSKDTTIHTLTLFEDYRKSIDSFFESERISLIQKYDENPKSQFLQKIEMENHIFKTCCSVRGGLKDVIGKEEQQITKKLLNSQSETLLSRQLSNLIEFSKEAGVSELIHNEFLKLQGENLEIYLSDVEKYSEELQKRDKEIQGLMFKMKKDLEQQKVKEQ